MGPIRLEPIPPQPIPQSGILCEAEEFSSFGGWVLDSQYELEMGSPYLLAHGNGVPVKDATTTFPVHESGRYNVWVRSKDWVPGHHPGRFTVAINGVFLPTEFGANDKDWSWELGGKVDLTAGTATLALHDLTGFCGRCDAIFLSREDIQPPQPVDEAARNWRRRLRGLPEEPVHVGSFGVCVVGGGVAGAAAALVAARLGEKVALIQDRPYLGGNASVEIGLSPRGVNGPVVKELTTRDPTGDLLARQLLEPIVSLFMEHTVYNTVTAGNAISAVDARDARSGKEIRITAPVFIDCSGKATLGLLSGAETLFGEESKAEYGESLAPEKATNMHHGNTLFFRTRDSESPKQFPEVPWATEVALDFANLGGQLQVPGIENGRGPRVLRPEQHPDPSTPERMTWPLTHFWEYGQSLDPYLNGEKIRDHLLRALYGTFYNVKTMEPGKYANLDFDWVSFTPAQGEYRRYKGDYVLNETDIRAHREFHDSVAQNSGAFCLHYPGHDKYDFRLKTWEWDERDHEPYDIPFRCLYSTNISNLLMAGKHISATHVAGSNTKFMGNGGQHAIATAAAAYLCNKYRTTPRGVYNNHLAQLKSIAFRIAEDNEYPNDRNAKI
ncbi:FAD dependent oxidoreductase [Aspergillus pseudocaelatus]|uniref:FAD dependent oxidoreductase n=1 Tax=Aspergillus pseudocaelatus TaxID=1825620 RepID=A0ABQ6WZU7_9EURO|nr:FAD dependent oxidoreductase [Aspergillus pseudocaelatus]